jgi:DNA-binding GntR family transcriptional regulator
MYPTDRLEEKMSGASERAYAFIRDAIISGDIAEGSRLREEDIAVRARTSRTPVREAIRRLVNDGFLEAQRNAGVVVATWDEDRVTQLFGVRAALESYGVALAVTRALQSDIRELDAMCDEMETMLRDGGPGFLEDFSKANTRFHLRLLRLSGNERLEATAAPMMELGLIMKMYKRFSSDRLARSCADHRDIVSALRRGDVAWGEAIMRSHILAGLPSDWGGGMGRV